MDYSLSIWKGYNSLPIVLFIVIANTSSELASMASESADFPFTRSLPCIGWAKACLMINKQSIAEFLVAKPLNPLVAISHVLIERKTALIDIDRRDDQFVQKNFKICRRIVCREMIIDEADLASYEDVYHHAIHGFNLTKDILSKNPVSKSTIKRAIVCIEDHVKALGDVRKRRLVSQSSLVTAAASSIDASGSIVPLAGSAVSLARSAVPPSGSVVSIAASAVPPAGSADPPSGLVVSLAASAVPPAASD
ncbi:unnamed protein product [Mucor hiemalis]